MSDNLITKSDIKFWVAIIGIFMTGVIAFTSLQKDVEAMTDREQMNKDSFFKIVETVEIIKDKVVEMETNQGFIMDALEIKID